MTTQQQKNKSKVIAWMEEEAPWYAKHCEWPVSELAEAANSKFDWHGQFSADWSLFMEEKRWNQAERVFKHLKLPMGKDA